MAGSPSLFGGPLTGFARQYSTLELIEIWVAWLHSACQRRGVGLSATCLRPRNGCTFVTIMAVADERHVGGSGCLSGLAVEYDAKYSLHNVNAVPLKSLSLMPLSFT